MAEKLTPQQQTAIENRGGKLLVSAAAGSGKTKVLVDRILRYITDPMDPANIDDFLIITYTQAAAAELRGKIGAKLTQAIAENPENRHLQQQMQRLYLAKISTVHAFCGEILREYAYAVDLPADFRVAEESECEELKERAMEEVLDTAYAAIAEDGNFRAFVDTQGFGRNDKAVPEIILSVFDSARCHTDPEKFLEECIAFADISEVTDAAQTIWGRYLTEELFAYLDMQIEAMGICAGEAAAVEGWEKQAALLSDTTEQLKRLRQSRTWDEILRYRSIDYGRLSFPKKYPQPDLEKRIKAVRENCKKKLEDKLKPFCVAGEQVLADIGQTRPAIRGLIGLVKSFSEAYTRKKRGRRVVDFGDLEHLMLDLMLGRHRTGPTAISAEVGQRFREIMVDEYQDSNGIQDAIFGALAQKRQNLFFVGDVKQSIYQFRLADPGIFLEKYSVYAPAEQAQPGQGRKVHLSSNFRSGGGVIEAVNHVFRCAMSQRVGDLDYGEDEALREGLPHVPLGEAEVELYGLRIESDTYPEEAAFVAEQVCRLLDGTHQIRDGEGLRPIQPEDIAILLRSPGSVGGYYQAALERRGIRCANDKGTNLLDTEEIGTLRAFLQVISNPRQDIPLLTLLLSPVFCFSADEIGRIRAGHTKESLFEALCAAGDARSRSFLQTLTELREAARMHTLAELIQNIFLATGLDTVYAAMEDGDVRRENLHSFYQICCGYENGGRRSLERFLDYLTAAEEKGLSAAGEKTAAGCVTIMSIHKSKGLEFPVVFLGGLSRGFNRDDLRDPVLCHRELGLGLSCVDAEKRIRYPSIAKRAIAAKKLRESLSEEMRILYVAMTRARDRLIMVYSAKELEKILSDLTGRMGVGPKELITAQASCPGTWVLMAALQRTEAGAFFSLGGNPMETVVSQVPWLIRVAQAPEPQEEMGVEAEREDTIPADLCGRIREGLDFSYAHIPATTAPSKQTATQRKGRQKDQEAAESSRQTEYNHSFRRASFREKRMQGKEYGNAIHAAMQYICYDECLDTDAVRREITRLVEQRYITAEQGELVNCDQIAAFFQTELGTKLRTGENALREFKFSILDDAEQYGEGLEGEKVLLQGVVDCALLEEDGITVIDFKTDRVSDATVGATAERYRVQVQTYVEALSRIYGKPVKEAWLYFFCLNRFIRL